MAGQDDFVRLCRELRELGAVQVQDGARVAVFGVGLRAPLPVAQQTGPRRPSEAQRKREAEAAEAALREKELRSV